MENQNNQSHDQTQKWDTKDELLLAFAVKRHGLKDWDSVSMELHSKASLSPSLTTASLCHQKYLDLHRRFSSTDTDCVEESSIPWLEELRQLRVSELKQEVQKYDLSILSLQLRVKRLEEEREKSLKEKETNNNNNDDNNNNQTQQQEKPENDKKMPRRQVKEIEDRLNLTHESLDSDRENRSVNESNSTGIEGKTAGGKEVAAVEKTATVEEEGGEEESGEVESSARRRRKKKGGGENEVGNEAEKKSEPLIGFDLDVIRAHKFGSFFEGRLPSQETEAYKNTIRQHMDLGIIQTRLEQGSYSSFSRLALYRDLLLLFNNVIVFHPKGSVEASAALKLRALVSNEFVKETEKSDSTVAPNSNPSKPKAELERSDSLLAKHKISVPIIVCRKRSAMSTKPSTLSLEKKNGLQQQQEGNDNNVGEESKTPAVEQGLLSTRSTDRPVTGTRSSRSNKNLKKVTGNSNKKQNVSPNTKAIEAVKKLETPKTDKIETAASGKKRSAADFLKRLKNSPAETVKKNSNRRNAGGGEKKDGSNNNKGEKQKEQVVKRNSNNKKEVKQETGPSRRSSTRPLKKGVEAGRALKIEENEGSSKDAVKRPRKRARR